MSNRFHHFLIFSCIASPLLLLLSWIGITYAHGRSIPCCAISTGIAYNQEDQIGYYLIIIATGTSSLFAFFVAICRQIQVEVKLTDYLQRQMCNKCTAKSIYLLNNIAVVVNISAFLFLFSISIFDNNRFSFHALFAIIAFVSGLVFLGVQALVTFFQRIIEYLEDLENSEVKNRWKSFNNTFFIDAILLTVLYIIGVISAIIYVVEFAVLFSSTEFEERGEVPDFANIAEWISLISIISSITVLSLAFDHDRVDDELIVFWKRITICCCQKY